MQKASRQMMSMLWITLPYSAFLSFVLGHVWRYRHDRFSWFGNREDSDPGQRFGTTALRVGIGVLIAARVTELLVSGPHGHPDGPLYVGLAVVEIGALVAAAIGAVLLFVPDIIGGSARPVISPFDRITFPLMVTALLSWVAIKFDPNSTEGGYRTAETLFVWFRSLFSLHPQPGVMVHAPLIYQARGLILMVFIAIWPYTRLAGVMADPLCRALLRIKAEPAPESPRALATG
ncbi:respiratory nitrate reductase subunit gamma [Nocardia brasiliensis]|uniref:respiratory nitrate reductase subunit gamma n=1 Tax=Nocardia brasiliensis TaxID=37326 RepID=UPI001893D862|nr:respiratory nitrate reductase subunit gamma [Nocardia brasiliensis]MBF6546905.1 respiratory nitrate reductase subunit gamma [Nocardia brasiliensis]